MADDALIRTTESLPIEGTTDSVGPAKTAWENNFAALLEFRRRTGHLLVTRAAQQPLYHWLQAQRHAAHHGRLSPERLQRFADAGIDLNALRTPKQEEWHEHFSLLAEFRGQFGHVRVPAGDPQWGPLYRWLMRQRAKALAGKLSPPYARLLFEAGIDLGILSTPRQLDWEESFRALLEFRQRFGHSAVPLKEPPWRGLAQWLRQQRKEALTGRMNDQRRRRFIEAGIVLEKVPAHRQQRWEQRFSELQQFQRQFGHCRAPLTRSVLARWLQTQCRLAAAGRLMPDRRKRLSALGVELPPVPPPSPEARPGNVGWEPRLKELAAFKARFGHCRVPERWVENVPLADWLTHQRYLGRRCGLPPDRFQRLKELGVNFGITAAEKRTRMLRALADFRNQYGHGQVPQDWSEDRALAVWLASQRTRWRHGLLSPAQMEELRQLGVSPDKPPPESSRPWEISWNRMFEALRQFQLRHGHCHIPYHWPEDQLLSHWLYVQRRYARAGTLRADRRERLSALGVQFSSRRRDRALIGSQPIFSATWVGQKWLARMAQLEAFHRAYGHCRISYRDPAHRGLWTWFHHQLALARQGRLGQEQIRRMLEAGVELPLPKPPSPSWEGNFARVAAFARQFGHCRIPGHGPMRSLRDWLNSQCIAARARKLPFEQLTRLANLGVPLDRLRTPKTRAEKQRRAWEKRFAELKRFRDKFGHCRIPRHDPEARSLYQWLKAQRAAARAHQLSDERCQRLIGLGIELERLCPVYDDAHWEKRFLELVQFKQQLGHCSVPTRGSLRPLYDWLKAQRAYARSGRLSPQRATRLTELGISLTPAANRPEPPAQLAP